MGYHKNKRKWKEDPFVILDVGMLQSEAWKELGPFGQCIYILLKVGYRPYKKNEVRLDYKEAEGYMCRDAVTHGFNAVVANGWAKKTKHGGLYRYYCTYKLTGKYDPDVA